MKSCKLVEIKLPSLSKLTDFDNEIFDKVLQM